MGGATVQRLPGEASIRHSSISLGSSDQCQTWLGKISKPCMPSAAVARTCTATSSPVHCRGTFHVTPPSMRQSTGARKRSATTGSPKPCSSSTSTICRRVWPGISGAAASAETAPISNSKKAKPFFRGMSRPLRTPTPQHEDNAGGQERLCS
jgi:hypothetical protein